MNRAATPIDKNSKGVNKVEPFSPGRKTTRISTGRVSLEPFHNNHRHFRFQSFKYQLTLEGSLYILIVGIAILTRFYDLDARALHHDEGVHAYYSWKYYIGDGYSQEPWKHGPFVYHIAAAFFWLFGDSVYTGRAPMALFGVLICLVPLALRNQLGRWGALTASFLLLISPMFLYYSRFMREDIFVAFSTLGLFTGLVRFVARPGAMWWNCSMLSLAWLFCTKEVSFFYLILFGGFLFGWLCWQIAPRLLFIIGGYLLAAGVVFLLVIRWFPPPPIPFDTVSGDIILSYVGSLVSNPIFATFILLGAGGAGLIWFAFFNVAANRRQFLLKGDETGTGMGLWAALFRPYQRPGSVAYAVNYLGRNPKTALVGLGLAFSFYFIFYTGFFTDIPQGSVGLFSGLWYWMAQQGVARGNQPWFYYFFMLPLYEPLALIFGTLSSGLIIARAIGYSPGRGRNQLFTRGKGKVKHKLIAANSAKIVLQPAATVNSSAAPEELTEETKVQAEPAVILAASPSERTNNTFLEENGEAAPGSPVKEELTAGTQTGGERWGQAHHKAQAVQAGLSANSFPFNGGLETGEINSPDSAASVKNQDRLGRACAWPGHLRSEPHPYFNFLLLTFWAWGGLGLYTWASEKMPWLTVQVVLPFILLTAYLMDRVWSGLEEYLAAEKSRRIVVGRLSGRAFLGLFTGGLVLTGFSLYMVTLQLTATEVKLNQDGPPVLGWWLLSIPIGIGLILLILAVRYTGLKVALKAMLAVGFSLLCIFLLHTGFTYAFDHGDVALEMGIYTQTTPDVIRVVRELDTVEIMLPDQQRTPVLYDENLRTPLDFYLRNYSSKKRVADYGSELTSKPGPITTGKNASGSLNFEDYLVIMVSDGKADSLGQSQKKSLADNYISRHYTFHYWFEESQYRDFDGAASIQINFLTGKSSKSTVRDVNNTIILNQSEIISQERLQQIAGLSGVLDKVYDANGGNSSLLHLQQAAQSLYQLRTPGDFSRLWRYVMFREQFEPLGRREWTLYIRKDIAGLWRQYADLVDFPIRGS